MKISPRNRAFALAVTLALMALSVVVIVAYLANSRTDRSTSSIYANRIGAKIIAESGLTAATKLLSNNTRYGNYITAMPIPSPEPASLYTEVYRPTDSSETTTAVVNDYLTTTNAAGEILASRVSTSSGTDQIDPRPAPLMIPSSGPFSLGDPGFTVGNSYDFNQIVRLGTNTSGRLVSPLPTPAFGQWVRVRNAGNDLIGRYAFLIEDESMKANVNETGNNLASGAHLRINDLTLPPPSPAPTTQLQEIDPAAILPAGANRAAADISLTSIATAGHRLASRSSLALLDHWNSHFSDHAHLATVVSRDDDTTAKGWERMDLNAVVASATDNPSKVAVANRIANWIRDAWTGPPLPGLSSYQMFNDSRLRLQIAANIVDYIDSDNTPTDMGDVVPDGYAIPVPVLGIEKIPYLVALEVIYEASESTCPSPPVTGTYSAVLRMKIQLRFLNLYESALDLADNFGRIEIKGVPIVSKNGNTVFDRSTANYVINLADLIPVNGTGTSVPAGIDGISDSGARTFQTDWIENQLVTYTVTASDAKPRFLAGLITARVFGIGGERLDDTAMVTNIITSGYNWNGAGSTGDFLNEAIAKPLQTASINLPYAVATGTTTAINFGDPRVRGPLVSDRWYNINRSDASTPATTNRIAAYIDRAEILNRTYAFDWYDHTGNRPLAFLRNGPMRSVGELGNVSAPEYPWRTIYLQYPERLANTVQTGPATEIPQRRNASVDFTLIDLFRTQSGEPRAGAININTQQRWGAQQHSLAPLFFAEPIGNQPALTQTMVDRLCNATGSVLVSPIFDRRIAAGPPPDNFPIRPFFQIGELASLLSRLVNTSNNTTTGSPARSTVTYSVLRSSPATTSEPNPNFRTDNLAEQAFREVSNSITTRGNVFRILYVGQAVKDLNKDGYADPSDIQAECLGEAFIERQSVFQPDGTNPDAMKTVDSIYKVIGNRVITE